MHQESKYDIVLIRHAQSVFNQAVNRNINEMGLGHLYWDEIIMDQKFNQRVTYNQLYIDPCLSQQGRKQCQQYRSQCQRINPDLILVSPYQRALQTCHRLFQNVKNVPVIVQPILAEVFRFSCDVTKQLENIKKNFPHVSYDKINHLQDTWYLHNLVQDYQQKIKKVLKHQNHGQNNKQILKLLAKRQVFQYPNMLRHRVSKIKKMLQAYKQKYSKIVVIAHNYTISFIKSKGFNEENIPIEYEELLNCHPYYEKLEDLLKVQ